MEDLESPLGRILEEAVNLLERLNQQYPHLASSFTLSTVEHWRNIEFKQQISEQLMSRISSLPDTHQTVREYALERLHTQTLEEVLDLVCEQHESSISYAEFVELIGEQHYIALLREEALELQANAVSHQQIASVWNDYGRPALGDLLWTSRCVASLLE